MNNKKISPASKFIFLIFLALFSSHPAKPQTTSAPNIFDNEDAIQKWLNENKIPALGIGLIRDGKLKQVKVYGELKKGETAAFDTIFNVASLTKPVVAMLTLKLVS